MKTENIKIFVIDKSTPKERAQHFIKSFHDKNDIILMCNEIIKILNEQEYFESGKINNTLGQDYWYSVKKEVMKHK